MSTNDQLGERTGTLAERPDSNSQRAGSFWTTLPDKTVYQVIRDPVTGAQTWEAIAGPGAGGNESWPKYVVSAGGPAGDPAAPYALPSEALTAAIAAGHGPTNPATILLHPGTYNDPGPVVLPGGIDIIGIGGLLECLLTQSVVIDPAVKDSQTTLRAIQVASGVVVQGRGSNVVLTTIVVQNPSGDGLVINTAEAGSVAVLSGAIFSSGAAINMIADASLTCEAGTFFGNTDAGLILRGGGRLVTGSVSGTIRVLSGTFNVFAVEVDAANGLDAYYVEAGGGNLLLVISGSAAYSRSLKAGGGDFVYGDLTLATAGAPTIEASAPMAPRRVLRGFTIERYAGAGPFAYDGADTSFVDPSAPAVFNLPPAVSSPDGLRISVKSSGAFAVSVTPDPADAIDGGAAGAPYVLPAGLTRPIVSLQKDTASSGGWMILGASL